MYVNKLVIFIKACHIFRYIYLTLFLFILEPSGKPQVTAAHNTSSTSVYLEWLAPPLPTIHGEFQVAIHSLLLLYVREVVTHFI